MFEICMVLATLGPIYPGPPWGPHILFRTTLNPLPLRVDSCQVLSIEIHSMRFQEVGPERCKKFTDRLDDGRRTYGRRFRRTTDSTDDGRKRTAFSSLEPIGSGELKSHVTIFWGCCPRDKRRHDLFVSK